MTIERLPLETVAMIIGLLDPPDAYIAKISCRVLFWTPRTLSDIYRGFDRWETYEVKARLEVPGALSPLCALCRKRHPRTDFSKKSLNMPAKIRYCRDSVPAIELGGSRLTLSQIRHSLGLRSKRTSNGSLRPSDKLIAPDKGSLHDPFSVFIQNQYRLQSELRVMEAGAVILNSILDISDYFRGQWPTVLLQLNKYGSVQDRMTALKKRFSHDPVEGGLHLCPHFALIDTTLLEKFIDIWHDSKAKSWHYETATREMTCKYCKTLLQIEGDSDYWMTVTIWKHLGIKDDFLRVEHAMDYPPLARHMSRRINVRYHCPYQRTQEHQTRSKYPTEARYQPKASKYHEAERRDWA